MSPTDSAIKESKSGERPVIGLKFPTMNAHSLAGTKVTLPDAAKGKVVLIVLAFKQESQNQLDSWLELFVADFGEKPGFTYYEVPMIPLRYKLMSFVIDGGMRAGIPREKHKNVITYYGNVDRYRELLMMNDMYLGYAFLLDRQGIIRWQGRGFASQETLRELFDLAKRLEG